MTYWVGSEIRKITFLFRSLYVANKDIQTGDDVLLINWNTKEQFSSALIVSVNEKMLKELQDSDFEGHEKFEGTEKMYEAYRTYYGEQVKPESIVKIIKFKLL